MKRHTFAQIFKRTITPAVTLLALLLVTGCGSDPENNNPGIGGGSGGVITTGVVTNADGSSSIGFSGVGTLTSTSRMLAGTFPVTTGNVSCPNDYTGQYFCFRNQLGAITASERIFFGQTFGQMNLGSMGAIGGASVQKYEKSYSLVDGGRSHIAISVVSNGTSVQFSGVLTLSSQDMANELRNNAVTSLAFDLSSVSVNGLGGQIFVITNSPYRSVFMF